MITSTGIESIGDGGRVVRMDEVLVGLWNGADLRLRGDCGGIRDDGNRRAQRGHR